MVYWCSLAVTNVGLPVGALGTGRFKAHSMPNPVTFLWFVFLLRWAASGSFCLPASVGKNHASSRTVC